MKIKSVMKFSPFFVASLAFGVLWLFFLNLVDVSRVNNYEWIVTVGFIIAAICMALIFYH